jgi:hypothetical protein
MKILGTIFALFVDDGSLALAILALLGGIGVLAHQSLLGSGPAAVALLAGTCVVLVENVVRTARRAARG